MKLGIPQVIMIVILSAGLGLSLAKHGEPYDSNHNFFTSLIVTIVEVLILYYGGFF